MDLFDDKFMEKQIKRPQGQVDMLIWLHAASLFPIVENPKKDIIGDLRLFSTKFGPAWLVDGQHPVVAMPRMSLTSQALHCRINAVEKACCRITRITNHMTKTKEFNFMECEEMGVHQPRRCRACAGCKNCSERAVMLSRKDSWELQMIDNNLLVDTRQGRVIFKYPLGKDPSLLKKPAVDSESPDEMLRTAEDPDKIIRMSANYDKRQRSTAGQKDDVLNYDLEQKDGEDSELPWVTKIKDPYEGLWDDRRTESPLAMT